MPIDRAIRSLFVAAALLSTSAACDKGDAKKDDAKPEAAPTEPAKSDDEGAPEVAASGAEQAPVDPEANAEAAAGDDEGEAAAGDEGEAAAADEGEVAAGDEGADEAKTPPPTKSATKTTTSKTADSKTADSKTDEPASTSKVDGKALYLAKCKSCHGTDGKGDTTIGKKVDIPSLIGTKLGKDKVVSVIEKGVPDTKMKGYKGKMTDEEIDAVAAFVKKL
jgi:mono/diheme cytochrome c family protein